MNPEGDEGVSLVWILAWKRVEGSGKWLALIGGETEAL
jgi:hypothetical protein